MAQVQFENRNSGRPEGKPVMFFALRHLQRKLMTSLLDVPSFPRPRDPVPFWMKQLL